MATLWTGRSGSCNGSRDGNSCPVQGGGESGATSHPWFQTPRSCRYGVAERWTYYGERKSEDLRESSCYLQSHLSPSDTTRFCAPYPPSGDLPGQAALSDHPPLTGYPAGPPPLRTTPLDRLPCRATPHGTPPLDRLPCRTNPATLPDHPLDRLPCRATPPCGPPPLDGLPCPTPPPRSTTLLRPPSGNPYPPNTPPVSTTPP